MLQNYSDQSSEVLTQKQTHISVDQKISRSNFRSILQLIYNKQGDNIQWGKDSLFSKWYWENWAATHKRINLD